MNGKISLASVLSVGVTLRDLSSRGTGSGKRRGVSSHTGRVTDQCQSYTQTIPSYDGSPTHPRKGREHKIVVLDAWNYPAD